MRDSQEFIPIGILCLGSGLMIVYPNRSYPQLEFLRLGTGRYSRSFHIEFDPQQKSGRPRPPFKVQAGDAQVYLVSVLTYNCRCQFNSDATCSIESQH